MLCAVHRRGSQLQCGSQCGDLVIGLITCDKPYHYPKSAPRMGVSTMWVYILTLPASQVRFSKWAKCVTSVPVECTPRPSEVQFGVRIGGFYVVHSAQKGVTTPVWESMW